ncbi:alpha-L-rhamnosidase-related protein [Ulvibacterium marinum]|uniref:Alpha-L-rhamnosidase n=1 Tax=Ulvibacterium marinum TaxID=2419782 RepID=A0A3B0BYL0_9FLAO|nr:family 78 glycoside hydrolase catalytic domain [Ulvibacterium marinum]RKN78673.1 alpha-L-rhamnosidase [Ulvibacterium marinum]
MKHIIWIALVFFVSQSINAQLPPVFGEEYEGKATTSDMVKTYLKPQRIVWQSDNSGKSIKNVETLIKKGNGQVAVNDQNLFRFISTEAERPGILLDYGKEINGGVKISMGIRKSKTPLKLRLRFGESVGEAMSDIGGKQNATNEHSLRDFIIEVPWLGSIEVGETGFRFLRIDVVEANENAPIKSIDAAFVYRDIPYLGSFESNDERLNQIWMTGAYTVHLNMQNYLWDGIKRDRLVWVGDMHPEVMTINTVFGNHEIVHKSLDLARDQHPLPQWMNGISSYSMWWLLIHKNAYDYHGDLGYLKEQENYMIGLLDQLSMFIDKSNKEILDGGRFMDWPTSEIPEAVHAGLQAMMVMTFEAGSEIMGIYQKSELQKKYLKVAERLRKHKPKGNTTKQAAALMAMANLEDAKKINEQILTKDGVQRMSTFYGYYILEAMAKANDYKGALKVIRDYWGGMLDLGATTFWEDFDILDTKNTGRIDELPLPNKFDIHGDFGEYCYVGYRHSFCHGWASGPTSWLSQHVLGIHVMDAGETVQITPHLGDLRWAKGSFPTKYGPLKVSHTKNADGTVKTEIDAPDGLTIIQ